MNASYHRGALTLQTINQMNVPQWFSPVHHRSEDPSGQVDQLCLAAGTIDLNLEYVTFDIEIIIRLPGGVSDAKRVVSNNLLITRQQVHFGVDHRYEIIEGDLAFEDAYASNVHWRFLFFEVKEARIH